MFVAEPAFIRLLNGVVVNSRGCWVWQKGRHGGKRYGGITVSGRLQLAHRVSYREFKGPIAGGLNVCHTCDNPLCINPDHLWLGTQKENMQDCADKGRDRSGQKVSCHHGHPFTTINNGSSSHRVCTTCVRENQRRRRAA